MNAYNVCVTKVSRPNKTTQFATLHKAENCCKGINTIWLITFICKYKQEEKNSHATQRFITTCTSSLLTNVYIL